VVLRAQGQQRPDRHERAATSPVERSTHTRKPGRDALRQGGQHELSDEFDEHEGGRHDNELVGHAARGIHELRQKSREEQDALRIGRGSEEALAKEQ